MNLRESAEDPACALNPWSRPVFVLLMVLPATLGIFAVRLFAAFLATVLAWTTMRMADDLELPRPNLAGLLLFAQPLFFALSCDTLTEMPMALGIALAIRLWWTRRRALSCLLVSLLPMIRPEGFLLIVMWAFMVLLSTSVGSFWRRRAPICLLLSVGMLCWVLACHLFMGNPLYVLTMWSWPPGSYENYGSGSLLHHVLRWPHYCGPILIVLFVAGVVPSVRRRMALPWGVWGIVFGVHTILWWGGWFAALGLMRIQACTAPITALVCLYGWNSLAVWTRRLGLSPRSRRACVVVLLSVAAFAPLGYYYTNLENHRVFPIRRVTRYVKDNHLLRSAPLFFTGEHIVLAELGLTNRSPKTVENAWDPVEQLSMLAKLPLGSIGVWDNQRSEDWYDVKIAQLEELGYEILYDVRHPLGFPLGLLSGHQPDQLRYVVLRRTSLATSRPAK